MQNNRRPRPPLLRIAASLQRKFHQEHHHHLAAAGQYVLHQVRPQAKSFTGVSHDCSAAGSNNLSSHNSYHRVHPAATGQYLCYIMIYIKFSTQRSFQQIPWGVLWCFGIIDPEGRRILKHIAIIIVVDLVFIQSHFGSSTANHGHRPTILSRAILWA